MELELSDRRPADQFTIDEEVLERVHRPDRWCLGTHRLLASRSLIQLRQRECEVVVTVAPHRARGSTQALGKVGRDAGSDWSGSEPSADPARMQPSEGTLGASADAASDEATAA